MVVQIFIVLQARNRRLSTNDEREGTKLTAGRRSSCNGCKENVRAHDIDYARNTQRKRGCRSLTQLAAGALALSVEDVACVPESRVHPPHVNSTSHAQNLDLPSLLTSVYHVLVQHSQVVWIATWPCCYPGLDLRVVKLHRVYHDVGSANDYIHSSLRRSHRYHIASARSQVGPIAVTSKSASHNSNASKVPKHNCSWIPSTNRRSLDIWLHSTH